MPPFFRDFSAAKPDDVQSQTEEEKLKWILETYTSLGTPVPNACDLTLEGGCSRA
jgi:hypothetical protein